MSEQTRELNGRTVKKAPENLNENGTTCDGCVFDECPSIGDKGYTAGDKFWNCFDDGTIFIDVK